MSKRTADLLVQDISEAIDKIEKFIGERSQEQFADDEKTVDAVVRNLEIIGEAANRLPEVFKKQSQIEWNKIVGLRHRIVHEYFGIDLQIVWTIIKQDIPELKRKLKEIPAIP